MANPQQREILRKGAIEWNCWRKEHLDTKIDLQGVSFREDNLAEVNLSLANLWKADFRKANLKGANLSEAYLSEVDFWEANLENADLSNVNLSYAYLRDAQLEYANLKSANFFRTDISSANLHGSTLDSGLFNGTSLSSTNFSGARTVRTIFIDTDLSQSLNLDKVKHVGPSHISEDTLTLSKGQIHESFLRGCGLSDWAIESAKLYNPSLTNQEILDIQYRIYNIRATQAIQIAPLFISYSHADTDFVNNLDTALTQKGVRFWRDIHDATAGRLETQIDRAIRQNPTVLLVLSQNSLNSDWVQHEVRKARELEKELGRDALCPVALDDSWKSSKWPARLMEQIMEYHILDFSGWENSITFDNKFTKLLSGLDLFYKKPAE